MTLKQLRERNRVPRVIGFDDAPFHLDASPTVNFSGVVCYGTRFEGLVWKQLARDGLDATLRLAEALLESKFHDQVQLVLIDGITLAGRNVVDLPALAGRLGRPCVAVVRRPPDMTRMRAALEALPDFEERWSRIQRAGEVHSLEGFHFQVAAADAQDVAWALGALTDRGKVPECLRLAHLIGSAFVTGQSSKRA
jgi:uncharacterized protein